MLTSNNDIRRFNYSNRNMSLNAPSTAYHHNNLGINATKHSSPASQIVTMSYNNGNKLLVNPLNKNKKVNIEEQDDELTNMNITTFIAKHNTLYKNFSSSFNQIIKDKTYKFNTSSASIIQYNGHGYIMNIRIVNYCLDSRGKSSFKNGDLTVTYNKIMFLDKEMNITNSKNMITKITNHLYSGIEDIRLFPFEHNIYYTGSSFNPHTKKIQIVSGILDFTKNEFSNNYIKPSFKTTNKWEKNWVFFNNNGELNLIYKWYPLYICKIDYATNELHLIEEKEKEKEKLPLFFNKLRGSTNGVEYDNKFWFITHFHKKRNKEKSQYLHCFIVFDKSMNVVGYSAPFNFENYIVEYCIGMTVNADNNEFIISYSTLDSTTKIICLTCEYVTNLIIPYPNTMI